MKDLSQILISAAYEPEANLSARIWRKISARIHRNAALKLWFSLAGGVFSLVAFVPATKLLLNNFAHSGFYDYVSLIFSGSGVSAYWKDLMVTLASSLPTASIFYAVTLLFVFIISLRYILFRATEHKFNLMFSS
jgi:hypothetical protein